MSNSFLIAIVYLLGAVGTFMTIRLLYRLVIQHKYYLDNILFTTQEDELPFEPKEEAVSLKVATINICKSIFKSCLLSMLLVVTVLSWFDLLLYVNRELGLNIQWLSEFYGPRMAILNLSYDEIYQCFSYLHIIVGVAFMLEPLFEIAYFKYQVSKMRPKSRVMTGLELFVTTNGIRDRFYLAPLSLMSKPRKALRKVLFSFGALLTLSWVAMQVFI